MSEDLGMGTTEESSHLVGNVPEEIDKLNSSVTGAAILTAVAFNILPEILSGPLDLEMSIVCNSCRTSSSVHLNILILKIVLLLYAHCTRQRGRGGG